MAGAATSTASTVSTPPYADIWKPDEKRYTMVETNGADDTTLVESRTPKMDDIRVNMIVLSRHNWPYLFDIPFIPNPGMDLASVGIYFAPAEFASLDGVYDTMCINTREPLVLIGYMLRNGLFLDPLDERVVIGKDINCV